MGMSNMWAWANDASEVSYPRDPMGIGSEHDGFPLPSEIFMVQNGFGKADMTKIHWGMPKVFVTGICGLFSGHSMP